MASMLFPHYVLVTSVNNTIKSTLGNALGFVALFGLLFLLLWALVPRLPVVGRRIRTNYQRWFTLHRLTGLSVIAGLIPGFLVDPALGHSTALLVLYIAWTEPNWLSIRHVRNPSQVPPLPISGCITNTLADRYTFPIDNRLSIHCRGVREIDSTWKRRYYFYEPVALVALIVNMVARHIVGIIQKYNYPIVRREAA
jgi:hypothetical protein